MAYDTKQLQKFEPERERSIVKKIIYGLFALTIVVVVIIQVVLSKINEIGNEKNQSISFVSKSEILYNMTWTLLPLHKFSFYMLHEVDRRMRCFGQE